MNKGINFLRFNATIRRTRICGIKRFLWSIHVKKLCNAFKDVKNGLDVSQVNCYPFRKL